MKKILFILLLSPMFSMGIQQDSIGTKTIDGIRYVQHKIEKGQTLYAISRNYNVDVNKIIEANPGAGDNIQVDAVLLIPRGIVKKEVEKKTEPVYGETIDGTVYHTVKQGETLFKIAKDYGVSVDEIKGWNGFNGETISVGQKLAVSEPRASIAIPEVKVNAPKPTTESGNRNDIVVEKVEKTSEKLTNIDVVKVEGNPVNDEADVVTPSKNVKNIGNEIVETGSLAISSDGELNQQRNFVLHPSARIGTIVMITNPENGKSTFARVVGNYTASGNQIVKINPTLAKKLNITESTKEVKVNYAR